MEKAEEEKEPHHRATSPGLKPALSEGVAPERNGTWGTLYSSTHWDWKILKVMCVARTSCKAQLENTPESMCSVHVSPAVPTPVSRTYASSCFHRSNYGSYSAIYTLQSGSIGDQGYTFVQQLDKGKGAKPCNTTIYLPSKLTHIGNWILTLPAVS